MKKKILSMVLVMMMVVSLAACGGKGDPIVGKWELKTIDVMGTEMELETVLAMAGMENVEMFCDCKSDGSFKMSAMGEETEGQWKASGDKYELTVDGDTMEVYIEDGKLVLDAAGQKMYFEK